SLKNASSHSLCQSQHVDHAHHTGLHRFHRVVLIVDWRSRTREVIDLIDLEKNRLDNVVAKQLKARIIEQRQNILAPSREKVVEANYLVTFIQESLTKM